jgi:hypothetical protein
LTSSVYLMVTADELLGAPLSVVVCEPFQPGCILVPLATWFLNLVQALFLQTDRMNSCC